MQLNLHSTKYFFLSGTVLAMPLSVYSDQKDYAGDLLSNVVGGNPLVNGRVVVPDLKPGNFELVMHSLYVEDTKANVQFPVSLCLPGLLMLNDADLILGSKRCDLDCGTLFKVTLRGSDVNVERPGHLRMFAANVAFQLPANGQSELLILGALESFRFMFEDLAELRLTKV